MNYQTRVELCECCGPAGVSLGEWRAKPDHVDVRRQQGGAVIITRDSLDPGELEVRHMGYPWPLDTVPLCSAYTEPAQQCK